MDGPQQTGDHAANRRPPRDPYRPALVGLVDIFWDQAATDRLNGSITRLAICACIFVITLAFAIRLANIDITAIG